MIKKYHNFIKKSTAAVLVFLFLFTPVLGFAKIPNDPEYSKQELVWKSINAPEAWEYSTGSPEVTVAVIDVGVDIANSDLKNNIWVNPFEIPDNGIDDDHNGYIDDVNGWNFIDKNNEVRPSVLIDWASYGVANHGTIVAGLIGAAGDNDFAGAGLNWKVKIMPIVAVDRMGSGNYTDIINAINYAVNNGADVINLSLTTYQDNNDFRLALYNAYRKGVVVVAAAGNSLQDLDSNPVYPACFDATTKENWIVGVGAMTVDKYSTTFSNYGKTCVDLYAPGENIYSTQRYAPRYNFPDEFNGPWRGTSFATPIVAGAAALIKSIRPDWSAKEVIAALLARTDLSDDQKKQAAGIALDVGDAAEFARKSLGDPIKKYNYYYSGNSIYRKLVNSNGNGSNEGEFVTKLKNGKIITASFYDFYGDYNPESIILYKINKYYYVKILSGKRQLIDFSIDSKSLKFAPNTINIKTTGNTYNILISNTTNTLSYTLTGNKIAN